MYRMQWNAHRPWLLEAPDKGDGATATPTGPEPGDGNPEPTTPPAAKPAAESLDSLPASVQELIRELRRENASHRNAKNEAQKAAEKAEEQRLLDEKNFRELAEKRQGQIAELQPKALLADALTEKIRAQIEAEIADWPAEVTALFPNGVATPVLELLAQVEKARPLAARLKTPETPAPGTGPRPAPNGQGGKKKIDDLRQTERNFVRSRF